MKSLGYRVHKHRLMGEAVAMLSPEPYKLNCVILIDVMKDLHEFT